MKRLYRFSKNRSRRNLYAWLGEAIEDGRPYTYGTTVSIGAGGEVDEALRQCGVCATTVDVEPARKPDVLASVEDLDVFADSSVDTVYFLEVMEHVQKPHRAAVELFRVLRPGGYLIGSTPFLLGIHDAPGDYFRFTGHGLRMLFNRFSEVSIRERNGYFAALAVMTTRLFVVGSVSDRKRAALWSPVLLMIVYALELIDRVLPSQDGTTGYFFIFRKPWSSEE